MLPQDRWTITREFPKTWTKDYEGGAKAEHLRIIR